MASREVRAGGHGETSEPGVVALEQRFDRDGLYALRAAVAAHASHLGASSERVGHVVIVASELASNAVRHGGGSGRLRLWADHGVLWCEISDGGSGFPEGTAAGTAPPPALATNGRGLWIVRRLVTGLRVESTGRGTKVTATVPLAPTGA